MCLLCASAMATEAVPAPVRVAGEKLDSGLGELPHYSKWADPTGKNPLQAAAPVQRDGTQPQRATVQVSQAN
jgi:hypothetical protein